MYCSSSSSMFNVHIYLQSHFRLNTMLHLNPFGHVLRYLIQAAGLDQRSCRHLLESTQRILCVMVVCIRLGRHQILQMRQVWRVVMKRWYRRKPIRIEKRIQTWNTCQYSTLYYSWCPRDSMYILDIFDYIINDVFGLLHYVFLMFLEFERRKGGSIQSLRKARREKK